MTKNKHDTKSNLAKLLATENISVQHKKVDTAYFDVKNRILCLPIWKEEMPDDVYDLLVGFMKLVMHYLLLKKTGCLNKKMYQFHSLTY